jgi:hypothetical protein
VLKGSSRVFGDEDVDWKRREWGCGCGRWAQNIHGAVCRMRNGDWEACGVVEVRSLRAAVERIDRMLYEM